MNKRGTIFLSHHRYPLRLLWMTLGVSLGAAIVLFVDMVAS